MSEEIVPVLEEMKEEERVEEMDPEEVVEEVKLEEVKAEEMKEEAPKKEEAMMQVLSERIGESVAMAVSTAMERLLRPRPIQSQLKAAPEGIGNISESHPHSDHFLLSPEGFVDPEEAEGIPDDPNLPHCEKSGSFLRNHIYVARNPKAPRPSFTPDLLGEAKIPNRWVPVPHNDGIECLMSPHFIAGKPLVIPEYAEMAGPRSCLYFDPQRTVAGIVTCGGLCPGLNNVIHALFNALKFTYSIPTILGFPFGYEGLVGKHEPIELTPEVVKDIHARGGTILGSSRGAQDVGKMVDNLVRLNVNILFAIGGDGTLRGALELCDEIKKRGLKISVIGIPKTIDNDICYIDNTFGFNTAVSKSMDAIYAVHEEARSAVGGVGIVKLMGRDAGFIALHGGLSSGDANMVLIPEIPFDLDVVLKHIEWRLKTRNHCVVVVAEGAGQHLMKDLPDQYDRSGNKLQKDIGVFLSREIDNYLKSVKMDHTVKYVDPSYIIRSARAIPSDALLCTCLASNAVHAALSGRTGIVICHHRNTYIHVPIARAIYYKKRVNPSGPIYRTMLEITGMPQLLAQNVVA